MDITTVIGEIMKKMKLSSRAKHAVMIGALCSVSYLAVYIARNILGAVTPQMIENGFLESNIGAISSSYFITYAIGQLINGAIGDKIKARYMICMGLFFAGIANILFPIFAEDQTVAIAIYASSGFFLAMIYGPMTKLVSENTDPIHATRCSLGYTFASFIGSPAAGILASFLTWKSVFIAGSIALIAMAVVAFCCFLLMERKGIIKYGQYKREKQKGGSFKELFRRRIIKFSLISILTGIIRTSVIFWLPTYIAQYLNFAPEKAAGIYTVATLFIATTAFISVFVYERLKRNMNLTILIMFSISTLMFLGVYLVRQPVINVIFMVLAIMSSNAAATMLWSRYCPSLYDTGMVSSVTGFLDFLSYMAAAFANLVFANAVTGIGWSNLILVWMGIVGLGLIVALPYRKMFKKFSKRRTDNVGSKNTAAADEW